MNHPHPYMICATPRSGSTFLCEALRLTSIAGHPDEYFGPMHPPRWQETWGVSTVHDYVEEVLKHGATPNGVFGVKIMKLYWKHFLNTLQLANTPDLPADDSLVLDTFPGMKFIWITRRDKVRQGVSWAKAMQGVPWTWDEDRPFVSEAELVFDFDAIDQFIEETVIHEAAWQAFFSAHAIEPFVVVYEDFVQAYEVTLRALLAFLDIPVPVDFHFQLPKIKQQANSQSEEWVNLYLKKKEASWQAKGWRRIGY